MAWNHLKLRKNDRVCLLSWKKSFWASQTNCCKFSEFHPCLSPNPWFGVWESLVWNMVTCQNGFKSLETLRKWSCRPSFMKKIVLSQSNSFLEVFRISPLSKSQSMIWFVGKSGVKYGNLSKWLEITWNFAKMIVYAFFHEKNRFELFKLIFVNFQNFTLV